MATAEQAKFKKSTCPKCKGSKKDSRGNKCHGCYGKGYLEGPQSVHIGGSPGPWKGG